MSRFVDDGEGAASVVKRLESLEWPLLLLRQAWDVCPVVLGSEPAKQAGWGALADAAAPSRRVCVHPPFRARQPDLKLGKDKGLGTF